MHGYIPCLVMLLVCAGLASPFASAQAETAGSLSALASDGTSVGACPLQHTLVRADITGILSSVSVTQKFGNSFSTPIEAIYAFPLPHEASVNAMTVTIGARTIRAVIKRRDEARADYDRARAAGRNAALLDQERPNIFTQRIANILPGQNVEVTIRYAETLRYQDGGYKFVFPTVVGPRYIPGMPIGKQEGGWSPDTDQVPDASRITPPVAAKGTRAGHDISIDVSLDTGVPFTNLRSLQHEVVVQRRDRQGATVRLLDAAVIPNKDFVLAWDVAGKEISDGLVVHRTESDGYFMLLLQPPVHSAVARVAPREVVFVLDTSGSMSGFPIEKAKETMELALGHGLRAGDTFNIITFSGDTQVLFPDPVRATPANLAKAWAFLESRSGAGGTEMMTAIRVALESSDSPGHLRIVCFMTDGFVGNDLEIIGEVQKHPNARVFAFGIGTSVNRFLLDRISTQGRGEAEYVTLNGDADAAAKRFAERINQPLLTDISIEWGGLPVADVYPARIPDLFTAAPVVLCGRYTRGGNYLVRLRGLAGGREVVRELEVPLPEAEPRHEVLGQLWARRRIGDLMSQDYAGMQRRTVREDVREAITALGLRYRIMTQFTSFVAVDDRVVLTNGAVPRRVEVPIEIPEGVSHDAVFSAVKYSQAAGMGGVVGGVPGGVVGGVLGGVVPPPPPPPPRPAAAQLIRVGGNVQEAKLLKKVPAVYPELARKAQVSGLVLVEIRVDEKGSVAEAKVLRGHALLRDAALKAVRQWKYRPTLLNGVPVAVITVVSVPVEPRN